MHSKNTVEIMDLLLRINLEQRVTCLMVTHNPDLECYADRVLYVRDGRFERQVRAKSCCCHACPRTRKCPIFHIFHHFLQQICGFFFKFSFFIFSR
jgi:ABC-type methionine transport system ATPase subunit